MSDDYLARWREQLASAIQSNDAKSFGTILGVLQRWCHEGCTFDSVCVGVCSHMIEHDGTINGALSALKEVGRMILKDIDDGSEGC